MFVIIGWAKGESDLLDMNFEICPTFADSVALIRLLLSVFQNEIDSGRFSGKSVLSKKSLIKTSSVNMKWKN